MEWQIEYSLRQNSYLKKRFFKGCFIAAGLMNGMLLWVMFLVHESIQTQGFMTSGAGIIFWIAQGFFFVTVFFLWLVSMTTYQAHYRLDAKQVRVRIKAKKARKAWLELLDFVNAASYKQQPENFSVYSLGSQGSSKISWRNVRKVIFLSHDHTLIIKGLPGEKIPVFYPPSLATELLEFLASKTPKASLTRVRDS